MDKVAPGKIKTVQLVALIFLTVSGGPYGLEPLVSYAGQHTAYLLLILTPIFWDLPSIATVLELNSMMPVTGGYYQWVKKAMGLRWAFYEGWWTWLYTFVDLAIYPVLFIIYLGFFFPEINTYKIPICLGIIWISTIINILGIVPVGRISMVLSCVVLVPFLIMIFVILYHHNGGISLGETAPITTSYSSLGMGLYTVMWNFIGWDNTTTYAEEVNKPIRTYLISVMTAFVLIFSIYFLTVLVSQLSGINPELLKKEGYPALGTLAAGKWLGGLIALGGMASSLGLYSAVLLSVSRVPKVMADDHLLPAKLHQLHPRFNTPYISIICCSLVVSVMVLWSFEDLLIIDVTLYGAALILEFISLVIFRITAPDAQRPFKIPFGVIGLCVMLLLPICVYSIAVSAAFISTGRSIKPILFTCLCLLSAEILWWVVRKYKKTKE